MNRIKYIILGISLFYIIPVFCEGKSHRRAEESLSPSGQILLGKLFSPNEKERINAALKLADYSNSRIVKALSNAVRNDASEMVKRVALRSLGLIGDDESLPLIIEMISSDSMNIKIEAMGAAINFSDSSLEDVLIEESNSSSTLIRQKAVTYLGSLESNSKRVVDVVIEKLEDISEGVRVAACKVLAKKKIAESVHAIARLAGKDRSEVVRQYAVQALGEIGSNEGKKYLKTRLGDSSPIVRITAAKSLARMQSREGLNEAIHGIKSSNARIRVIACEVLGLMGDEKSSIFLEQASQDFDLRVKKAAETALLKIRKRIDNEKLR